MFCLNTGHVSTHRTLLFHKQSNSFPKQNGNRQNARFLWKRIPSAIKKSDKELTYIWNIGKPMYKGDLVDVHKTIHSGSFSGAHKELLSELQKAFQARVMFLLSSGYSSISSKDLSASLGVDDKKAEELAVAAGWEKSGNGFYKPKPPSGNKAQNVDLIQLQQLTDYFCFLSSKNWFPHSVRQTWLGAHFAIKIKSTKTPWEKAVWEFDRIREDAIPPRFFFEVDRKIFCISSPVERKILFLEPYKWYLWVFLLCFPWDFLFHQLNTFTSKGFLGTLCSFFFFLIYKSFPFNDFVLERAASVTLLQ